MTILINILSHIGVLANTTGVTIERKVEDDRSGFEAFVMDKLVEFEFTDATTFAELWNNIVALGHSWVPFLVSALLTGVYMWYLLEHVLGDKE